MITQTNNTPSWTQIGRGMTSGFFVMLCGAPFVNGLNRISVVACSENVSSMEAYRRVYNGTIDSTRASLMHFGVGMTPYLIKETSRLFAKTIGLIFLKPTLENHYKGNKDPYGTTKTNLIFSLTLTGFEMAIQPIDTLCTMWQARRSITSLFQSTSKLQIAKYLYNGTVANGARQFTQWMGYSISEAGCNDAMKKYTSIDPHSILGIGLKSWPQSFFLTFFPYPFQRCKTELQYRPLLAEEAKIANRFRYVVVVEHIINTQGIAGMARGFFAKVASNSVLVAGVSILLERGRRALEQNQTNG